MALRKILLEKDPTLRKKSKPVTEINRRLLVLLDDMADTLHEADGAGLAAVQVGILKRVVVIDVGEGIIELINPEIISSEGEIVDSEGCLSVPERSEYVARPQKVTVRAQTRKGDWQEYTGEDLLARAFCHELDHLDGVLYIDKICDPPAEPPAKKNNH